jgi:hypothetical protein
MARFLSGARVTKRSSALSQLKIGVGSHRNTRKTVTNRVSRTPKLSCDKALVPLQGLLMLGLRPSQFSATAVDFGFTNPSSKS